MEERNGSVGSGSSSSTAEVDLREQSVKGGRDLKGQHREYEHTERNERNMRDMDTVRNANTRLANPYCSRSQYSGC